MVIRTREEALRALSALLDLDRAGQIVRMTVFLAECLTPETRQILFRAQEGLVYGHLETRARKRVEPEAAARPPEKEKARAEAPVDDSRISEEIQTALAGLKVAAVVFEVFPELRSEVARWEIARTALYRPEDVKRLIGEGTDPARRAAAQRQLATGVRRYRPWWYSEVSTISETCKQVLRQAPDTRWPIGAMSLLDVVATTELRAMYAVKGVIPNQPAMVEPLARIYVALHRIVRRMYPAGLPAESALAE